MNDNLAARAERSSALDHDPRILWPGLDRRAFDGAIDAIITVAQRVLQGERAVPLAAPGSAADVYGRAAFRLGAGGMVGHWIHAGAVRAPDDVARVYATHLEHGRRRHARLTAELERVVRALRSEDIEPGVLKGLDSARFYPEPGARVFQDIDLFVHPRDAERAAAVLAHLGFEDIGLVAGRRQDWTLPGQPLRSLDFTHADNPWNVDLHWRLGRTFHRALTGELPEIDPRSCPRAAFGAEVVAVLPPELRLGFIALHASSAIRTLLLSHLVDLVLAARATAAAESRTWADMIELLARAGSTRFAYPPLVLARRLAPDAVPQEVLDELAARVTPRLRRTAARLPLTGLAPPDRWRVRYAMMWVATASEAWQVIRHALKPGRFRTLRENLSLMRRAVMGLLRGTLR